ncbi:MAG: hypothetical protein GY754_39795 [bacterium]|nr:hypothetical protein [bacterium]
MKKHLAATISIIIFFILLVLSIAGCGGKNKVIRELTTPGNESFVIWAHSDIQPRRVSERVDFENAVNDIINAVPKIDLALVAGDIVNNANEPHIYTWYFKTRARAGIPYSYEIAGNHDAGDMRVYRRMVRRELHYAVTLGNLFIIMMSDETRSNATNISDAVFRWWKENVVQNQDKIIITVTHAPMLGSGLASKKYPDTMILKSERFAAVLKNYKVDIWFSGHQHSPQSEPGTVNVVEELGGTLFINMSSIRRELSRVPAESRVLYLKQGSPWILVRSRQHDKRKFNTGVDRLHRLRYAFKWKKWKKGKKGKGTPPLLLGFPE